MNKPRLAAFIAALPLCSHPYHRVVRRCDRLTAFPLPRLPVLRRLPSNLPLAMATVSSDNSELDLAELVQNFKKNVSIKDRRFRLQTYKNTFVGSDAVQWMVTSGTAETREDAIKLGLLMQEAGLIEHCVRDHEYVCGQPAPFLPFFAPLCLRFVTDSALFWFRCCAVSKMLSCTTSSSTTPSVAASRRRMRVDWYPGPTLCLRP